MKIRQTDPIQEYLALSQQESELDQEISRYCQSLLAAFRQAYPPIQRVSSLALESETLRRWLDQHREAHRE